MDELFSTLLRQLKLVLQTINLHFLFYSKTGESNGFKHFLVIANPHSWCTLITDLLITSSISRQERKKSQKTCKPDMGELQRKVVSSPMLHSRYSVLWVIVQSCALSWKFKKAKFKSLHRLIKYRNRQTCH